MPFAIVPAFVNVASPAAVKVYVALALRADHDTGICWPSHRTLANDTAVSIPTVRRALKELEAIGAVSVTRRWSDEGDPTSNLYRLSFAVNKPVDNGLVSMGGGVMGDGRVESPVINKPYSDEPYIASLVEKLPRDVGEAIENYLKRLAAEQRRGTND